jgi:ATP-binding cassette subfamily D (ALD) protein 2
MISIPLLLSEKSKSQNNTEIIDVSDEMSIRTEQFTLAKNLLISAADAVERIMTSYKEVIELTGFTRRVYDMFEMFDNINHNQSSSLIEKCDKINYLGLVNESSENQSIYIDKISVITPNGDMIIPSLTLKIEPGMNLLITGPNGWLSLFQDDEIFLI